MKFNVFFIFFLILVLAGCGERECKVDSDCAPVKCFSQNCEHGKCVKTSKDNCCGNLLCEKDAGENPCNCEMDCKPKCEGKYVLEEKGTKKIYAKYLGRVCKNEQCILGIDEKIVNKIPLVDETTVQGIKLEVGTTFNKPFDLLNDRIEATFKLKDYPSNVLLPFKITNIQILAGEILYGQKTVNKELSDVGAIVMEFVPLTFKPEKREEEKSLSMKVDYEFTKTAVKGDETVRGSFEKKFSEKIFLVKTGEE